MATAHDATTYGVLTADAGWPPRSTPPPLGAGALHLWRIDLDALRSHVESFRATLCDDELARARRFVFARDAERYEVGRGIVRFLLSAYLEKHSPNAVVLQYGSHGKPTLEPGAARLEFNLAHAHGVALLGVTRSLEIGVDIECEHEIMDLDGVMRVAFADAERARIGELTATGERRRAFFRCWTRKEAVLKALGWGLARSLQSFEVSVDDDRPCVLRMNGQSDVGQWTLLHMVPAPGFVAAAAWRGPKLTCERFTFER